MRSEFKILLIALLIAAAGVLAIYSSAYQKEAGVWRQQIIWVALGIMVYFALAHFNYRSLWNAVYFLYALILFLLFLVFLLGITRMGAQRWLRFAGFNFQPSELAKLVVIIFLARYFSRKFVSDTSLVSPELGISSGLLVPFVFVALPMVFIIEQPDLGSALMLFFVFLAVAFLARISWRDILLVCAVILLLSPVFWHFLKGYQRERLMVFLNPNVDPLGAGYTLIQSKIAIGSGGLFGKGWLSGTQSQLHFLPESHTDFIFATFAEEWGFAGSIAVLILYYLLVREGFLIAQRSREHFGSLLAYGISLLLSMQIFINIAMTMGLVPIVGLPLPLMSYGGSSIVVTFAALGILASIDK